MATPALGSRPQRGPQAWVGAFTGFYPAQASEFAPPRPDHPVPVLRAQRDPRHLGPGRDHRRTARGHRPPLRGRAVRPGLRRVRGVARDQQPVQRLLRPSPWPRHRRLPTPALHPAPDRQRCGQPAAAAGRAVRPDRRRAGYRGVLHRAARTGRGVVRDRRRDPAVGLRRGAASVEGTRSGRGRRVRGVGPADDLGRLLRHHRRAFRAGADGLDPLRPRRGVHPRRQAHRPAQVRHLAAPAHVARAARGEPGAAPEPGRGAWPCTSSSSSES